VKGDPTIVSQVRVGTQKRHVVPRARIGRSHYGVESRSGNVEFGLGLRQALLQGLFRCRAPDGNKDRKRNRSSMRWAHLIQHHESIVVLVCSSIVVLLCSSIEFIQYVADRRGRIVVAVVVVVYLWMSTVPV
jgi:hypothetical protein